MSRLEGGIVRLREAFAEFEAIERKLGLDDSPLFKVLRALLEQVEQHENQLQADTSQVYEPSDGTR